MVYQFRLITYNVMSTGPKKEKRLKHIVRNLIGHEGVDFVLLQDVEFDDTEFWKGEMFERGFNYCMGSDVLKTRRQGEMVFSRIPFESVKFYQFSRTRKNRGLTVCQIDMEGMGLLTLATTWLEHIHDASTKSMVQNQVTGIFRCLKEFPNVVLAGDFGQENMKPTEGWQDAWKLRGRGEFGTYHTYYSDRFHPTDGQPAVGRRHDYVLFKGDMKPVEFYKIGTRANKRGLFPSSHDGIVCAFEYEECAPPPTTTEDVMNMDVDLSTLKSVDISGMTGDDLSNVDLGPEEDEYLGLA
jgi:endonuclease/exonuclease/phosphatase family metal-dependent hydrolase